MHRTPVRDIMRVNVVTIGPDDLVVDAAEMMEESNVRRLPVVDDENFLVGIVTDSDVLEAETADSVMNSYDPDSGREWLTVADIMTRDVITMPPDATIGQLATLLMAKKIGGVPVVEPDPHAHHRLRLIGIVTEMDIFKMIAQAWAAEIERVGER